MTLNNAAAPAGAPSSYGTGLSLAGVPLMLPTAQIVNWIAQNISVADLEPVTPARAWPGPGSSLLGFPLQQRRQRRVEVNRLHWPRDASRYAWGLFLATRNQVVQIAQAAFGPNGTAQASVTLTMAPAGQLSPEAVSVTVYCLTPYPLSQIPPDSSGNPVNGLYLVPVVDQRYYWWGISCPAFGLEPDNTDVAWLDVYSAITGKIRGAFPSLTFNVGKIDPNFYFPSDELEALEGQVVPPILDVVALNCGQRIVANLDGSFTAQNVDDALASRKGDDANNLARTIRAGNDEFNPGGNGPYPTGSLVSAANFYSPVLPANVEVWFPGALCSGKQTDSAPSFFVDVEPLSTIGGLNATQNPSLANYSGFPGAKVFHDSAQAQYTGGNASPDNQKSLINLSRAVASAYYRWRSDYAFDRVYNGNVAPAPDGYVDSVEWTYRAGPHPAGRWFVDQSDVDDASDDAIECTTRARTSPWDWEPEELHHRVAPDCPPANAPCTPCGPGCKAYVCAYVVQPNGNMYTGEVDNVTITYTDAQGNVTTIGSCDGVNSCCVLASKVGTYDAIATLPGPQLVNGSITLGQADLCKPNSITLLVIPPGA